MQQQIDQDDLDNPVTTELEEINNKLKEAWKDLRKACNIAREECDAFPHECALNKAIKNNTEVSKEMEKIRRAEEQTSTFQKLGTTTKDQQHGALNRVKTPNGEGGWNTIFEAERMCKTLIDQNKKHFAQANNTLFADTDRGQHLGRTGTGMVANSMVDGTCT